MGVAFDGCDVLPVLRAVPCRDLADEAVTARWTVWMYVGCRRSSPSASRSRPMASSRRFGDEGVRPHRIHQACLDTTTAGRQQRRQHA
jgi:hypothetical protein